MPDTLTSIFHLLDLRSARCTRLEAGGDWSLRFPDLHHLKFVAVIRGACWMVHPAGAPVRMKAGDAFLLSRTPAYVLASDPDLPPEDGAALFDWSTSSTGRHGGDETVLLGGAFEVASLHERLIGEALPPLTILRRDAPSAVGIRRTLELMEAEFAAEPVGPALIRHHLADMLLVQMLRAHIADGRGEGWIGALTDPRLGAALDRIHAAPHHHCSLHELATAAGMSRSAFAAAFHRAIGCAPIDYAIRWRMRVAEDLLHRGLSVGEVAERLGYSAQSAFGAAFKRVKGHSPGSAQRAGAPRDLVPPVVRA